MPFKSLSNVTIISPDVSLYVKNNELGSNTIEDTSGTSPYMLNVSLYPVVAPYPFTLMSNCVSIFRLLLKSTFADHLCVELL